MKKIKYLIILLALSTSLTGCFNSNRGTVKATQQLESNKSVQTDASENFKVYKYSELGYEIAYPGSYDMEVSGGHSPAANPEFGMRLSIYSKDGKPGLDIDSIDKINYKDKYKNAEDFIKYKNLKIKLEEDADTNNKIYKLEGDKCYFVFFENDKYIFQISSSSKDLLKKITKTFKFI